MTAWELWRPHDGHFRAAQRSSENVRPNSSSPSNEDYENHNCVFLYHHSIYRQFVVKKPFFPLIPTRSPITISAFIDDEPDSAMTLIQDFIHVNDLKSFVLDLSWCGEKLDLLV